VSARAGSNKIEKIREGTRSVASLIFEINFRLAKIYLFISCIVVDRTIFYARIGLFRKLVKQGETNFPIPVRHLLNI
jgi:hypothetical protein